MLGKLVVLVAGLVTADIAPLLIPDAVPMDGAADRFRAAHAAAEACTGRQRSFDSIKWYKVPGANFKVPGDTLNPGAKIGLWVKPDTIYVSASWTESWVPKHEIIHYLLQQSHYAGDSVVWGHQCRAMWGYLPPDSTPMQPGVTGTFAPPPPPRDYSQALDFLTGRTGVR